MNSVKAGIYAIVDFYKSKIYIGSSCNLARRLKDHERYMRLQQHSNKDLCKAYQMHGLFLIPYILEVVENKGLSMDRFKDHLKDIEQEYLNDILFASEKDNRFYKLGYNKDRRAKKSIADIRYSTEAKKRIGRPKGSVKSKEEIENNRLANLGKKVSDETRAKMSVSAKEARKNFKGVRKKRIYTESEKNKLIQMYAKRVLQFDFNGRLIAEYESATQAKKITKISGVVPCCLNTVRKAHNFVFIYKSDYEKMSLDQFNDRILLAKNSENGKTSVQKLDAITGEILAEFKTLKEAGDYNSGKADAIGRFIRGKSNLDTLYGFKWRLSPNL